jgi:hypothetical protein
VFKLKRGSRATYIDELETLEIGAAAHAFERGINAGCANAIGDVDDAGELLKLAEELDSHIMRS